MTADDAVREIDTALIAFVDSVVVALDKGGVVDHAPIRAAIDRAIEAEHERTRLEYQYPMECGHAKGNLLTCTETEPSGCLMCIAIEAVRREATVAAWNRDSMLEPCERHKNIVYIWYDMKAKCLGCFIESKQRDENEACAKVAEERLSGMDPLPAAIRARISKEGE